jgi:glycine oxidase
MPGIPDVLVVGGGAVGAATARALATAGARVRVVRPAPLPGEAWSAAAGMLAAQVETVLDDPLFTLGVAGRAFYRREAEALREATGIDIGFHQGGILQVATAPDQVDRFKAKVAWQRQAAESADFLTPEEVVEGWPWLAPGFGGFWAPEDGSLHPDRLVEAMLADATRRGAVVTTDTVRAVLCDDGAVTGVAGDRGDYSAGGVVIAAGAWSGRISGLPRPLSVEPVRGQLAAWPWPAGASPVIAYGDRCYLLERGGELIAGATMEYAGFDAGTDDAAFARVLARVTALAPSLAGVPPRRRWAGLRPGTPDALPIVGAEPRLSGLWYATGHGRNGILLAGVTGELIAQAIGGEPLPEAAHALRPERLWSW